MLTTVGVASASIGPKLEYRAGYESLDLSLRYALTDSLTLFVDGNNLTDETYVAFEGDPSRPSEVEQIGARWMAGVRFNF